MKQAYAGPGWASGGSVSGRALQWPLHSGSTRAQIVWRVVPRDEAYRRYRLARYFNRQGSEPGRRGGRLGSAALRVLEALIFDFWNYSNGRLDPSYEAIARVAGLARSTVGEALARLRAWRVIVWQRRCRGEDGPDGFRLAQETNAYDVLPPSAWLGYKPAAEDPPPPHPDTLGCCPPQPEVIEEAAAIAASGASRETVLSTLELAPAGSVAAELARLGRLLEASELRASRGQVQESDDRTETGPSYKT